MRKSEGGAESPSAPPSLFLICEGKGGGDEESRIISVLCRVPFPRYALPFAHSSSSTYFLPPNPLHVTASSIDKLCR